VDWQLWVGPAVGVAGLLFAIYAYNQNRKPKRLQYEVRVDQEIVSQSRYTRWADLSVRFGDRDLKRPRVVVVRVTNTGKVEARGDDFDEPLAVSATKDVEIIAATIALRRRDADESQEVEPSKLDSTEVIAPKAVLNEGEWLEFRLLVEGDKGSVRLRGHAAGFTLNTYGSRRRFYREERPWLALATLTVASLVLALMTLAHIDYTVRVPNVVGKPVQEAVNQINSANLKLGTVNRVRGAAKVGTVISESPSAGEKVDKDSSITLVVSDGP
jgi:hypothetical protein